MKIKEKPQQKEIIVIDVEDWNNCFKNCLFPSLIGREKIQLGIEMFSTMVLSLV